MTSQSDVPESSRSSSYDFSRQADQAQGGLLREFWDFLRYNKKWWLTPIILMLLPFAALIMLSGTAAAPFIYTLF